MYILGESSWCWWDDGKGLGAIGRMVEKGLGGGAMVEGLGLVGMVNGKLFEMIHWRWLGAGGLNIYMFYLGGFMS